MEFGSQLFTFSSLKRACTCLKYILLAGFGSLIIFVASHSSGFCSLLINPPRCLKDVCLTISPLQRGDVSESISIFSARSSRLITHSLLSDLPHPVILILSSTLTDVGQPFFNGWGCFPFLHIKFHHKVLVPQFLYE
jgi:hypothetical protein